MFSSLQSRLWLTYLLVIGLVLAIVTLALLAFLLRNPRLTREAEANLLLAANAVQRQRLALGAEQNVSDVARRTDELLDVRVIVLNLQGEVLADSRAEGQALFPAVRITGAAPLEISEVTDENGVAWLFTRRSLQGRHTILLATPRPTAPVLAVFSDELFQPVLRAGLVALLLSLVLSFLIARWIGKPLQGMSEAARAVAEGNVRQIEPRGPREVQLLAHAFNDMSQRVHASQQSQRDFVANVSHDLKTPLTSVQGFAQAILDGTVKSGGALQQAAQVIYNEAERMHRLVVDLLDLARLDAGTAKLERQSVDIAQLIVEVVERFFPQAATAQVDLSSETSELPPISGDYDRLVQVFANLVENAIKFTPKGGQIRLSARQANSFVEASVTDTGVGISSQQAERIFERFYQGDPSRGGEGRGVGLGLPIARQIVQAHGGEIRVESRLGEGSRFIVRLPLKET